MITRLRNRKPDAYSVIPKIPRYYAFLTTEDLLVASIYANDGTWLADLASIPLPAVPPSPENGILLHTAPNTAVAPGALAWRSDDNELTVWDIANAQFYTYQGTVAAYCSPPVQHEGRLFWVEFPDQEDEPDTNQATLTLRHAACDLSDPQTLSTVVFSTFVQSWDLGPRAKVAASAGALLFESLWRDNINGEVADAAGARFPFAPTGAEAQDGARIDLAQGFAAADGTAVGLLVPDNTLRSHSLILGTDSIERWPTTGAWELSQGFGQAFNAAVTADGATALLYGYPPEGDAPIVLEAATTATSGEPTALATVASHPVHGALPILLFFLESSPTE
jgi:hypothetical protein